LSPWELERNEKNAAIDAVLLEFGVTMAAHFVPQSMSRSRGEKRPSLNWIVTVIRPGKSVLTTDYMQGIGHVPGYPLQQQGFRKSGIPKHDYDRASETGKYPRSNFHYPKLSAPELRDVLHSLLMDTSDLDGSFESWAGGVGYDTDSRKAEALYHACLKLERELRALFSVAELERLREVFQDY
jgi:hypothetical protein